MTPPDAAPTRRRREARLAVAAIAAAEAEGGAWLDDAEANLAAAGVTGDNDAIAARAHRLAERHGLARAIASARTAPRDLGLILFIIGGAAGLAAAWAGLSTGGGPATTTSATLNVVWFLAATLGPHTLMLAVGLLWTLALLIRPRGDLIRRMTAWLAARGVRHTSHAAAAAGAITAAFAGRRGLLKRSIITNLGGLGFATGAAAGLLIAMVARDHYVFFWKTTLLDNRLMTGLVELIGSGPLPATMPVPTAADVAAARWTPSDPAALDQSPETQRLWANWLLIAVVGWAAAPRVYLILVATLTIACMRRGQPALAAAYRERVLARIRLAGRAAHTPEPPSPQAAPAAEPAADARPLGPPVSLAYEIDPARWAMLTLGDGVSNLGVLDGAGQRDRILLDLDNAPARPASALAVFSRGETPARAERTFIRELARRLPNVVIALDLPPSLDPAAETRDAARTAARTEQWRRVAEEAGLGADRIVEIDLLRLTPATRARLATLLAQAPQPGANTPGTSSPSPARFEPACALIAEWAARPHDDPDASLARLFDKVNTIYEVTPKPMPRLPRSIADARHAVYDAGARIARVLPPWFPGHPRWMLAASLTLTAGTLAGVAALGGPIGLAAGFWPLYAVAGATLGELLGRSVPGGADEPVPTVQPLDRVRAALLHAMVLELQGRPDAEIAARMDAALRDAPSSTPRALIDHARASLVTKRVAEGVAG